MAQAATAVHHEWVRDFTDGAIDPAQHIAGTLGGAPKGGGGKAGGAGKSAPEAAGGKKAPPVFQLAIFSDHAGTRKTMELCDTIHHSKAVAVKIGDQTHKVADVFAPIQQTFSKVIRDIEAMNAESRKQAKQHLDDEHGFALIAAKWAGVSAEKSFKAVYDATNESHKQLMDAGKYATWPAFALAYSFLLGGINKGFEARDACGIYGEDMIKGGEQVIAKLEIARNGTFAAVGVLSGVAEVGIVVEAGIALLPVAAEALNKILTDEKVNWGTFGAEVLLTLVMSKFKLPLKAGMEGACKSVVLKLLAKVAGRIQLTPAQEEAIIVFVAEKVMEKAKDALVAAAGALCKEKEKDPHPKTYKEIATDFIAKVTSREFVVSFVEEKLLTEALAKMGVKVAAAA